MGMFYGITLSDAGSTDGSRSFHTQKSFCAIHYEFPSHLYIITRLGRVQDLSSQQAEGLRSLSSILLTIYNIAFHDAPGPSSRVLHFDSFDQSSNIGVGHGEHDHANGIALNLCRRIARRLSQRLTPC